MWLLFVQLLSRNNRYGIVWTIVTNPPELPIDDEARKEAHTASTCATVLAQKTKRETSDVS